MDKILASENRVYRHCPRVRLIHWLIAISTTLLFFSGFGQMPMYSRYGVVKIPGLGWSGDFHLTLNIHYLAGLVLVFAVFYHLVYHGLRKDFGLLPRKGDVAESWQIIKAILGFGKEPVSDKFLAEQRLAYGFIGVSFLLVMVTGFIKVLKNAIDLDFPNWSMVLNTNLHNLAAILLIVGVILHLGAFIFKENRPLLGSMLTGKVCLDYAKHRHGIWLEAIEKDKRKE